MLMQQRFLGVSPLETIGELPEDGSMSDRDVPKQCSRIGIHMPLGLDHSSYQDNSGIMNHDRDTDVINKVINSNSVGEMQLADDVSTNVESVIDSVSSLSTFTSSLRHDLMSSPSSSRQDLTHSPSSSRQDLSPSPSCSFGSEESISDDSGTFQIQTFSLDDITHSGHQETIRNSQSNIGNSHLVFHTSVDSMTANNSLLPYTPAGGKTTMQGDDQCVHIEVFKSPPIKPTPVRKSVQKMRQRRRSKPKLIEIPEEKNDNVVDETHTTVMPLKSELVDEKNAADILEIKKENDQIIAEFSSKSEESVKSPSCVEVCVNVSAMEKETSNDCYETVQKYNPSNCSERLTQAKLVPSPREQHMPSIAHQFVTEEHELVQEISPIIPSLPGAAAVTEKKNGTMTPENYRESGEHDIAKSEAESSHSKITNSTRKTGSFKTAMNRLKTLVKAENYLPQCSHYSSHERALKKAGYNLKDLDADIAAQAESNKEQKSGRKSTAVEPKFAWSSPSRKKPPSRRKSIFGRKQSAEISRDEYERILDGRRESYGMVNRSNKKKLKHAKEKSAIERKQNMKNAKRIANYLKLIKKHPQQYLDLKKSAMEPQESDGRLQVSQLLITMAEAYQRSNERGEPESMVLQAAYELGHNHLLPVCARHEQNEKKRIKKLIKDTKQSKRSVRNKLGIPVKKSEELFEKVSEVEKCHVELEIWLKTLTTAQMLKARELALRQLGESEHTMRKWWVTQKYCRYLRKPYDDEDAGTLGAM